MGKYLYGIIATPTMASMGNIGIDESEVYSFPYRDISALIHDCESKVYSSDNREIVKRWIVSHQSVVDKAWKEFGVIVPAAFDTIIKDGDENLREWLVNNYDSFVSLLTKFTRKAEYGIQVSWNIKKISEWIMKEDNELLELQSKIQSVREGTAYLYKKKIEQGLKKKLDEESINLFDSLVARLRSVVDSIVVEKPKYTTNGNFDMIINISCLTDKDGEKQIGILLDEVEKEGYVVRFTGPWPPYSFIEKARNG